VKTQEATPAKRPYHHGDLENALLDAAVRQIAEVGVRGMSLREVARMVGVSHAAVYRHFPSKESLIAKVAEDGFRKLSAAMASAGGQGGDNPMDRFKAVGLAYIDFALAHPQHLQLMFGGVIKSPEDFPELQQAGREAKSGLAVFVRGLAASGYCSPEEADIVALSAWSQVHGLATLIISGQVRGEGDPSGLDYRALAEKTISVHWRGFGAGSSGKEEVR